MKKSILRMISLAMISLFAVSQTAFADEAQLMSMVSEMQKQMTDLQSTVAMQKAEISALKTMGPKITMAPGGVEAAPAMSEEDFTKQFDKNLKGKIGGADKWLKDLKFKGDLRLRYEPASNARSAATDVNRFRFRLRYGFEKMFSEEFKVGFRMASGGTTDPTSTNQTFDAAFANKTITIDAAYAIYNPKWALIGPISDVEIGAGKVDNPLSQVHSWLTWDSDVTPEGIYEKSTARLLKTENLTTDIEGLAGQWVINEDTARAANSGDAELFTFSGGLVNKFTHEDLKNPITLKNYVNYELSRGIGKVGSSRTATAYAIDGVNMRNNDLYTVVNTGDLGVLSFYNELAWKIDPLPKFKLFYEYGQNTKAHMINDRQRHLYVVGGKLGDAKKKGEWELGYTYGHLEKNSTFSVWADSDFGFTNRRGSVVKAGYALTDYLTLNGAAFLTQAIIDSTDNSTTVTNMGMNKQTMFQLDLVWKF
jgi:hypothetical protein